MRISTILCIDLFGNREELRREEKKAYGGCLFISYSHHSPRAIFTITSRLFLESHLRVSTEEKGAVTCHSRRLMASIKHVLNPKNNERIRNIDRKVNRLF